MPPQVKGSLSIYKNLFDEVTPINTIDAVQDQREKKIECILDYWFYTGQQKVMLNGREVQISYNSLLQIVSNTFFISPFTLHDTIKANRDKLALVKQEWKNKPADEIKETFSKKWPQFVW